MSKWIKAAALAIAVLVIAGGATAICLGVSWLIRNQQGMTLANEGFVAGLRGDQDEAIQKLTAALEKPLFGDARSYAYLDRGTAYNWKSQFDLAIRDFTEALRDNPGLAEAYNGRGFAFQREEQIEKALADLDAAIRLDPNSVPAYYNRALIFYDKGDFDQSIADCDEAARTNPGNGDALVLRGRCYLAKNDLDRALAAFDGAIAADPTNPNAYQQRANLYSHEGDWEKSGRDSAQAIHLRQTPALEATNTPYQILVDQQNVAHASGDYDLAITLCNQILAMDITPAQASFVVMRRGNAYTVKQDLDKALQDHNEAIKLNPKNAPAYCDRALDLEKQGKVEEAIDGYSQAIRTDPDYVLAYQYRGRVYRVRHAFDLAMNDITKAIALNGQNPQHFVERAQIYIAQNKLEPAINDCNRALELDSSSVDAHICRAMAYRAERNYSQALQDIEAMPAANPKRMDAAMNSLAWFRATCRDATMRNGKEAVEAGTKACDLSHWKNWGQIDTLAAACAEAGKFDDAVKYEKQALQLKPNATDRLVMEQHLSLYQRHKPYRE